jgi:hypothetical protein
VQGDDDEIEREKVEVAPQVAAGPDHAWQHAQVVRHHRPDDLVG